MRRRGHQKQKTWIGDILLLGVYAIGLIRAWELLGARRYGLLGWLNPLYNVKRTRAAETEDHKASSQ